MDDHSDEQKPLTDFERFMSGVNLFCTQPSGLPLGEQLCAKGAQYEFTANHPDGLMLATFTVQHDGQERPTNYTGMISLIQAEKTVPPDQEAKTGPENQVVTELTIGFYNDRGYQQLKVPLRQFLKLMSHPRAMGSHQYCIRNGTLIREEKTQTENQLHTEGSHAANPDATSHVA
ncbi:MAG: hypothetical protein V1916_02135 [Patescibacteria group bacterium]